MEKKDDLQMNELHGTDDADITEKSPLKNDTDGNDGFENKKNGKESKDDKKKKGSSKSSSSSSSSCLSSLRAKLFVILIIGLLTSALIVAYLYFLHNKHNKMEEDSEIVEYLTTIPTISNGNKFLLHYKSTKNANNSNWVNYTNEITEFLDNYNVNITKETNSSYELCNEKVNATDEKLCLQDISEIQKLCSIDDHYGYPDNKPCIFLKFHPFPNFTAEPYASEEEMVNYNLTNYKYNETYLYLHCEGYRPVDNENIGSIQYAPASQTFPMHYFKKLEDEKFMAPFIAIKLNNIVSGIVIGVQCRLLARNIMYDNGRSPFQVQFDVLID